MVDNIQYFTIIFLSLFYPFFGNYGSKPFPSVGHLGMGAVCPLWDNLFGPSYVIYIITPLDYITSVSEDMCSTFHRRRQPPTLRQKDVKISQLHQTGLAPATYKNKVSASKDTKNYSHLFSGHLALPITSQINSYTRTLWKLSLSWQPNLQLSLLSKQTHRLDPQNRARVGATQGPRAVNVTVVSRCQHLISMSKDTINVTKCRSLLSYLMLLPCYFWSWHILPIDEKTTALMTSMIGFHLY